MIKRRLFVFVLLLLTASLVFALIACSGGGTEDAEGTYYALKDGTPDKDDWIKLGANGRWEDGTDRGTFTIDGEKITFYDSDGEELFDGTISNGEISLFFGKYTKTAPSTQDGNGQQTSFTVTFDSQGGSAISPILSVPNNSTATPPSNNPIKLGHTFGGWYKEAATINEWDFYYDTVTSDVTVYAKWTANVYTVTYRDAGDASFSGTHGDDSPSNHTYGAATALVSPSKTGYSFDGWFTDDEAEGTALTSLTATGYTADITLYAKWSLKNYTVNLDKQDGAGGTASVTVAFGSDMPTAVKPSKTGYIFGGYYALTNGGGKQYYNSEMQSVNAWTTDQNPSTLYAKWNPSPNQLVFDGNGKTSEDMDSVSVQTDENVTLPANLYEKTGYSFAAWNTKADGTGTDYGAGATYKIPASDESITLYARWSLRNYTINYENLLDGENPNEEITGYTYISETITFDNPTRTGYDGEWDITEIASGSTENKTITAIWSARAYTVTLNPQSGAGGSASVTATYDSAMPAATAPTRSGFKFLGYYSQENGLGTQYYSATMTSLHNWDTANNTTVLYAYWIAVYPITFDGNGHTDGSTAAISAALNETVTLPSSGFTRYGHYFAGWSDNFDDENAAYGAGGNYTLSTDSGVTLYAIWHVQTIRVSFDPGQGSIQSDRTTAASYTVSFNLNGGTGTTPATQTITPTTALTYPSLSTFSRSNYVFSGWYENSDGSGSAFNFANAVTKNVILYAKWISYNETAGGTRNYTGAASINSYILLPYYVGTHIYAITPLVSGSTVSVTIPKYSGIAVDISFLNSSGSTMSSSDNSSSSHYIKSYTMYTGSLYYIKITLSQSAPYYQVDADITGSIPTAGGKVSSSVRYLNAPYGSEYGEVEAVRAGYSLEGWYTGQNGTGDKILSTASIQNASAHTLYANWTANGYTVSYDANGGVGEEMSSTNHTYDQTSSLSSNTYTRDYYTFAGWNTMPDGSGKSYSNGQQGLLNVTAEDGDTAILYAQWTANRYSVTATSNNASAGSVTGSGTYAYESTVTLKATSLDSTLYSWLGWYDGGVKVSNGSELNYSFTMPSENKSFEARWGITYLDENGTEQLALDVPTTLTTAGTYTLTAGWYILQGNPSSSTSSFTINGIVHIILKDGCNWNVNGGIQVPTTATLYIYAQSTGDSTGKLSTTANIGGLNNRGPENWGGSSGAGGASGKITINGGIIKAVNIGGGNGDYGAAASSVTSGTGRQGSTGGAGGASDTITINGGTVTATNIGGGNGGNGGAGGQTSYNSSYRGGTGGTGGAGGTGGTIIITGGTVTATNIGGGAGAYGGNGGNGYSGGYGGTGGAGGNGGIITISGGTVTATNIGGGASGYGGSGCEAVHSSGNGGNGGNGGAGGNGGIITISGGTTTVVRIGATSGGFGNTAGNGASGGKGGNGGTGGEGGAIIISGGIIYAEEIVIGGMGGKGGKGGSGYYPSGSYGVGGNGGNGGNGGVGGTLTISGGTVSADKIMNCEGGINGEKGSGNNQNGADGTAGSAGASATVTITGGSINAQISVDPTNGAENGSGILSLVVIETGAQGTTIETGTADGAEYYGFDGVVTDSDGKLYLWLPAGVTEVTVDGTVYPVI